MTKTYIPVTDAGHESEWTAERCQEHAGCVQIEVPCESESLTHLFHVKVAVLVGASMQMLVEETVQ